MPTIFDGFEKAGEPAVRDAVNAGRYSMGEEASARAWLARKEEARRVEDQRRSDASHTANLEVATSAKDAAWAAAEAAREAAREAKTANIIATLALVAAVIAIAVSVIGAFLGARH
jgi:hypothetical protein